MSQLKTVLQCLIRIDRDELVLPRVRWVDSADTFDRISQGVSLRPHEDRRQLGPQTYFTSPEQLRERVPRPVVWRGPRRDFPIHTPRFYGKAGPAERSARRADLRLRALRECYTL